MIVCIAEKPSVAKEIADILGAKSRKDGYFEGNGYQVTWTYGHLCTLREPHDYSPDWKKWRVAYLPIIPPRFGIKLIDNDGVKKQFAVIEKLFSAADEVVNCGDAGIEGELIQRWVMQKALCKAPVKRLWISSLTEDAIKEGFKSLSSQDKYQNLYEAGLCRAIGDWLLGINATRMYTLRYAKYPQMLSIGRVQTPTLALIVNRFEEIKNFVPKQYFELKTIYRETSFSAVKGKFDIKEDGEKVLNEIENKDLTITGVSIKQGNEFPPKLFDLTSLQVECNKKFSFSADETLKLVQSLYEKKVTTYPRVDTTFLSDDMYKKIPGILQGLKPYSNLTAPVLEKKIPKSKKVFDNSKVTDHHAIIPTGVFPKNLNLEEKRVYDMVAKRFIAAFYPNCKVSNTKVSALVEKIKFAATGKQILDPGWRNVYSGDKDSNGKDNILPPFEKGEHGPHIPSLTEKWTQPPKNYTEATLLRAMETAGKLVDNEELRDALKENGIGRPSTRAAIIETLFKRDYVVKQKKNLIPTSTGIDLIHTIKDDILKSAELTGMWEKKLRDIEHGIYPAEKFIDEIKQMVTEVVMSVKKS